LIPVKSVGGESAKQGLLDVESTDATHFSPMVKMRCACLTMTHQARPATDRSGFRTKERERTRKSQAERYCGKTQRPMNGKRQQHPDDPPDGPPQPPEYPFRHPDERPDQSPIEKPPNEPNRYPDRPPEEEPSIDPEPVPKD
jgi:hypothetical protein